MCVCTCLEQPAGRLVGVLSGKAAAETASWCLTCRPLHTQTESLQDSKRRRWNNREMIEKRSRIKQIIMIRKRRTFKTPDEWLNYCSVMFLVYFIAQYLTYNTLTYNYYYKTIKKIIHNIKNDIFCHTINCIICQLFGFYFDQQLCEQWNLICRHTEHSNWLLNIS